MAAIPVDAPRALDAHRPLSKTSLAVAGSSTVIEWYDFTLYLYLTTVISRVFFGGGTSGTAWTLLVFAGTLPPSAIPSTLIIDEQGRLAARVLGEISELTLVAMIDEVAAE